MDEQYRSIFEAGFEGHVVHDNGIIIAINPRFEELLGYKSSELIGKSFLMLVAENSTAIVMERMRSRPGEPFEIEGIKKDGTHISAEVVGKDHMHEGRKVRIVSIRDLSEVKRLEKELRLAEEKLDSKVKRQMVTGNPYQLTLREFTILHHVTDGVTDKEIAAKIGISVETVRKHVASLRRKMKAASRTEVASRAVREGLVA